MTPRPRRSYVLFAALIVLIVTYIVTQTDWSTREKYYPVTGTLLIDGKPGDNIQIHFHPVEGEAQVGSGWVGSDGKFDLYSGVQGHSGAAPGKYRVVLSQGPGSKLPIYRGDDAKSIPNTPPHTFPPQYLEAATSPDEVEVQKKANTFAIKISMPPGSTDPEKDASQRQRRRPASSSGTPDPDSPMDATGSTESSSPEETNSPMEPNSTAQR